MDMIVMGLRGTGKTLFSVAFAGSLSRQFGLPIVSNIGVNFPGSSRLRSIEHFANTTGAVVLMDEAHRNLDARQWKDNKQFTDTLLYNRKRMKHVLYTTPHVRNLDVRIREIVPILVVVEKIPRSNGIKASFYDVEKHGLDAPMLPFRVVKVPDKSIYYSLYDTAEEAPILPGSDQEAAALLLGQTPGRDRQRSPDRPYFPADGGGLRGGPLPVVAPPIEPTNGLERLRQRAGRSMPDSSGRH